MKNGLSLMLFIFVIFVSHASAGAVKPMSADELKTIADAKNEVVIVDVRSQQEYRNGHIPAAIHIPVEKWNVMATLLPEDKTALIVFYCSGTS